MRLAEAKRMVSQTAKIGTALRAALSDTEHGTEHIKCRTSLLYNVGAQLSPEEHPGEPIDNFAPHLGDPCGVQNSIVSMRVGLLGSIPPPHPTPPTPAGPF